MAVLSQRSFAAGEIAPAVQARVDNVKYASGLKTCRNFMVMKSGGATNRPGTSFVGEVNDSDGGPVRLIPFVFNNDQTYVLEFGNMYMRVHRNGAQVMLTAQNITAITNANPCVVTYSGSDTYANDDEVYISGITGAIGTYLNGRNFKVANVNTGANTFSLKYMDGTAVNSTSFGAYTSGGTVAEVYTLSTPYAEADIFDLHFVQSADVITIAHPNYAPRELTRSGHTSWTLTAITFSPAVSNVGTVTVSVASGTAAKWIITTIDSTTGEESLGVDPTATANAAPSSGSPITLTWDTVSGALGFNVYRRTSSGAYGFIGFAGQDKQHVLAGVITFIDSGVTPDTEVRPPTDRTVFATSGNYPSTVSYIQQRLTFANSDNDPERVWASRSGYFKNFSASTPATDGDAITFDIVGRQVNEVRHILELEKPFVLTKGGEHWLEGNNAGVITPTEINRKQLSYNGASNLQPIVINETALYVQDRGSTVRDLLAQQVDGVRGNDLTTYSTHLVEGKTIDDWTYQRTPNSIVWMVRDDGTLLGLTYVREQQITAWHKHDFDGLVESVCAVPEGTEDALYLIINRTINGATKRYIERMETRFIEDIKDAVFMDAALTYDGRNTSTSHTMTMSEYSGGGWLYTSTVTLTSSTSYFTSSDVGNQIHLTGADGTIIRLTIDTYVSGTVVRGRPHRTVPSGMQSVAISDWARAVDQITGLWHLEGEAVSILADGFVVASPNNEAYETQTVTNGTITLDRCYGVIHIGIPYISDLETLDIDTPEGQSIAGKKRVVHKVYARVDKTRGLWAGPKPPSDDDDDPLEDLNELQIRNDESYDDPVALASEVVEIPIRPEWNSNGRVFLRQVDPLPVTVLAVQPEGSFPFK